MCSRPKWSILCRARERPSAFGRNDPFTGYPFRHRHGNARCGPPHRGDDEGANCQISNILAQAEPMTTDYGASASRIKISPSWSVTATIRLRANAFANFEDLQRLNQADLERILKEL